LNNDVFGIIHDYFPRERLISLQTREGVKYYYFSRGYNSLFEEAMKHSSVFVEFITDSKEKIVKGYEASSIMLVHSLFYMSKRGRFDVFDFENAKEKVREIINHNGYKMFIDFEMNMPSWQDKTPFTSEIIQIGCVIVDPNDTIVNYYNNYIKSIKPISDRAKKFLSLGPEAVDEAIDYLDFYRDFKQLLDIYKPIVYVWGGNDIQTLMNSFEIHKVKPLSIESVDLLKMHHIYFELKNDIGLFNALKIYTGIDASQAHHALTDAQATKEVFDGFKRDVNGIEFYDIKKAYSKQPEL